MSFSTASTTFSTASRFLVTPVLLMALLGSQSCDAAGIRAGNVEQRRLGFSTVDCSNELSMNVMCLENCNLELAPQEGVCLSKMFKYNGGPCDSSPTATTKCEDVNPGPLQMDSEVFVVVSDVNDPTKSTTGEWIAAGGYFWADYKDPDGLGDIQNITFYYSDDTSYDNMIQTMIVNVPCGLGISLEEVTQDHQSVELMSIAVDPRIIVEFQIEIKSLTDKEWGLAEITWASSSSLEQFAELHFPDYTTTMFTPDTPFTIPQSVTLPIEETNNQLIVLATAKAVTESGMQCQVDAIYSSTPNHV